MTEHFKESFFFVLLLKLAGLLYPSVAIDSRKSFFFFFQINLQHAFVPKSNSVMICGDLSGEAPHLHML